MSTEEVPWWEEGDESEAIKKEKEKQDRPGLRRFYLPAEVTNEITFMTDKPFVYREHNWKANGHWKNWAVCMGKGCPLCRAGQGNYLASAWLVVDHSEWTDKDGNEHKDEPRLFIAKPRIAQRIMRLREANGTLRGVRVSAYRSEAKASNVGDEFENPALYTAAQIKKLKWWAKEKKLADLEVKLNGPERKPEWAKVFDPKTPDQLANVVREMRDGGQGGDGGDDDGDDKPIKF